MRGKELDETTASRHDVPSHVLQAEAVTEGSVDMKATAAPRAPHSGFVQVKAQLLSDRALDPTAFKVLLGLLYFCTWKDDTFVGHRMLADFLYLSIRVIPGKIKKLEALGYVRVVKKHPVRKTYIYWVDKRKAGIELLRVPPSDAQQGQGLLPKNARETFGSREGATVLEVGRGPSQDPIKW